MGRPEEALTKDRKNTEERRLGMSEPAFPTTDPTETAGAHPAAGPSLHCTRPRERNQSKQSLTLRVTPLGQHSLYLFLPDPPPSPMEQPSRKDHVNIWNCLRFRDSARLQTGC